LLADRLQHAIEIVLFEQQRSESLQADHFFESALQLTIKARIVEADRRLVGERRQQLALRARRCHAGRAQAG